MTTTEQAVAAGQRLARSAAIVRAGVDSCPYPVDAAGPAGAARRAWLNTYWRLRPDEAPRVDYGDAVTALAHGDDTADLGTPATRQPDLFAEADQ